MDSAVQLVLSLIIDIIAILVKITITVRIVAVGKIEITNLGRRKKLIVSNTETSIRLKKLWGKIKTTMCIGSFKLTVKIGN